jgi:eukaryotic-like serine/threonine-protein kinase
MTDTTVATPPPSRPRPTWGLLEGDEIAPGRTVLRRIAGGRRYETVLVWDEHRLAVLVAKLLRPDMATVPEALDDLAREASLVERLAHPVVVRGFGAELDGRFAHLVLEHLDGPTLEELLVRDGSLALEQLLPLGLHVASALHYLAAEGVVHLDVKPSNVVMGGPPRLIDLSVARTVAEAAAARTPIGTNAYMAPEQRTPDGRMGPATDVFGLAATLCTALNRERRFLPLPRRTPRELVAVLTAGLDPDPAARPTAFELASALEPLVAALPRRMTLGRRS